MQQNRKGMFLPGILVTTVLATMFIGAALSLAPSGFLRAEQNNNLNEAEKAAQAGVEYALARLQKEPAWNGTAADILSSSDFSVHEDHGNVVGLMRNNGLVSQFRIRFNLHDGNAGMDSLNNPPADMRLDFPLVSFNNLQGGADLTIPKNTSQGRLNDQAVPGHTVYLAVEGRSGKALAGITPGNINAAPGSGGYSHKVLRCSYKLSTASQGVVDAVTMAANAIHATLPGSSGRISMSGDKTPALRSKANIQIDGGSSSGNLVSSVTGKFRVPQTSTPAVQLGSTPKLSREDELATNSFYQIGWNDVPKAGPTAGQLPAGTYVFWDDGSLHYYDVAPKDYPAFIDAHTNASGITDAAGAGTTIPLPATLAGGSVSMRSSPGKAYVDFNSDVNIATSTGGVTDIAILPKKGAALDPDSETAGLSSTQATSLFTPSGTDSFTLNAPAGVAATFLDAFGASVSSTATGSVNYNGIPIGSGTGDLSVNTGGGGVLNLHGGAQLPAVVSMLQTYAQTHSTDPAVTAFLSANAAQTTGGVPTNAQIKATALDPEDISVDLTASRAGRNLTLSNSAGSIVFGAQVSGQGSSIVSANEIQILGAGTDLSATTDPEKGLNIYAKGDVTLSTYNPNNVTKSKSQRFNKISLKGIVYTWGDFKAILGSQSVNSSLWGNLSLNGTLVAYGGDPTLGPGNVAGKGRVDILASQADLRFDSTYLLNLVPTPASITLARAWWSAQ